MEVAQVDVSSLAHFSEQVLDGARRVVDGDCARVNSVPAVVVCLVHAASSLDEQTTRLQEVVARSRHQAGLSALARLGDVSAEVEEESDDVGFVSVLDAVVQLLYT